ncbi:DNA-directed RNA polymerase subunit K [archaeon]|nr:DNA-directed RNA polymerase subunit K [archaeon]
MAAQGFSKYERARIIGARGLQISMDAPLLVDVEKGELDAINFDPLRIAEKELDSGVLPISVNRPMPEKKEEPIEDIKIDEDADVPSDAEKIAKEREITKEIAESGTMEENDEVEEKPVDKVKAELE